MEKINKKSFNNPVVVILVIILLCLVGYFVFSKNSSTPQDNTPNPQQAEIDALKNQVQTLQNTKPKTVIKEVPAAPASPAKADLQTVIKEWEPYVAYVDCKFSNPNSTYSELTGSGMFYPNPAGISILTNKHVIKDSQGYGPDSCSIEFPNYDNNNITTTFNNGGTQFRTPYDGADAGFISIDNPDSYIKNMKDPFGSYCQTAPSLGDQVVILGFPAIGSPTGVTVTQGIVSGFDGDYFITDAKIDHGNSGGVAIDLANDCYLGLPTWAATGQIESLARILNWKAIHN